MNTHQCLSCHTPHDNPNVCPECRQMGNQIKLCPTHFTGYSPACRTCRKLARI